MDDKFLLGEMSADLKAVKENIGIIFTKLNSIEETLSENQTTNAILKTKIGFIGGIGGLLGGALITVFLKLIFKI